MLHWLSGNAFLAAPQAIAPIGLTLAASSVGLPVKVGAAMFAAMLFAQIVGAVPATRLGRNFRARPFMRNLILFRGLAFSALAVVTMTHPQPVLLVLLAALAGSSTGALFALARVMLNTLVGAGRLPRALGLLATLNEVIFVLGPALAGALGLLSGVAPLVAMAVCAFAPLTLLRLVAEPPAREPSGSGLGSMATIRRIAPLLFCGLAMSPGVGAIEVGAVALTEQFGLDVVTAAAFPITLCVASAVTGLALAWGNRRPPTWLVAGMYGTSALGQVIVVFAPSAWVALGGTVLTGAVLAPTATYLQLTLDDLLPARLRAEGFALQRTAQASGIVLSSTIIAVSDVSAALTVGAVLAVLGAATILTSSHRRPAAENVGQGETYETAGTTHLNG